jgi:hypothetical protein
MIRVLIERLVLPGTEAPSATSRARRSTTGVRRQIAPMLAAPEKISLLEPI